MRIENVNYTDAIKEADLFVFGLGYESRCTHIAEHVDREFSGQACAIGYDHSHVLDYNASRDVFYRLGVTVLDNISDTRYSETLADFVAGHASARRVVVDISSLNRARIAAAVELLSAACRERGVDARFLYAPARFLPPSGEVVQNKSIGPISASSSGGLLDPELAPALIVGLGYETGKALGAVEYLQCSGLWLLIPRSRDSRFETEVRKANKVLIDQTPPNRVFTYSLEDPAGTYADLCSILRGIEEWSNPILLPLGPKLFALLTLLAQQEFENASVWRASQGEFEIPASRTASGQILGVALSDDGVARVAERTYAAADQDS